MNDFTKEDAEEYVEALSALIQQCEGAMMAAKGGDYLHNFSFSIQTKIRSLRDDIGYKKSLE